MKRFWFDKIPKNREYRWELMESFIEYWLRPLSKEDQISEKILNGAEKNLEIRLPEALKEWYKLVGNAYYIWFQHDLLLLPTELYTRDGFLIFYRENQMSCWDLGISLDELFLPDPPVYLINGSKEKLGNTFSEFVLHLLLYNMPSICSQFPLYNFHGEGYWNEQTKAIFEKHYIRTAFISWKLFTSSIIDFYEGQDIIIQVMYKKMQNCNFYVIAKTNSSLIKFHNLALTY